MAPALLHIHGWGKSLSLSGAQQPQVNLAENPAFIFLNTVQCYDSTKGLALPVTEKNNIPMLAATLLCDRVLIPMAGTSVEPDLITLLGQVTKAGRP